MFEILTQLSDNQVALLGCLGTAAVSLLLLTISYHSRGHSHGGHRSGGRELLKTQPSKQIPDQQNERRAA